MFSLELAHFRGKQAFFHILWDGISALNTGSPFMLPLLMYGGGFATLCLQDQISGVIFLRKVYKSMATRKKRPLNIPQTVLLKLLISKVVLK